MSLRIVGAFEIRKLLGVSRQRAYQLTERPDFPQPIATLAQGQIWILDDVETWILAHRPGAEPDHGPPSQPNYRRPDGGASRSTGDH